MAGTVFIRAEILDAMLAHARREPELEICGLLAGRAGVITEIFPAGNALRSRTAYEISPRDLFHMFRRMRAEGLDHLGIYHSHPATENIPSPKDIELSCYPDQAYFILSPRADAQRPVRAFRIREGRAEEMETSAVNS